MEREIKFRGKRLGDGKWLYGSYFNDGAKDYILPNLPLDAIDYEDYQVDSNTVGQFTNYYENNEHIYEGDIVKEKYGGVGNIILFRGEWRVDYGGEDIFHLHDEMDDALIIIGNIHDNLELLYRNNE